MTEQSLDAAVAEVVTGLMQVRRRVDPATMMDLLGSIMVEIELGLDVADEIALEMRHRRRSGGSVLPFPSKGFDRKPENETGREG